MIEKNNRPTRLKCLIPIDSIRVAGLLNYQLIFSGAYNTSHFSTDALLIGDLLK